MQSIDERPSLVPVQNPVPFNLWAGFTNRLFYQNLNDPLRAFRTLGSSDPLLPRALASSIARDPARCSAVHEVGSGNFFFAKEMIRNLLQVQKYATYDFSSASYETHGSSLPPQIQFTQGNALDIRKHVNDSGAHIVGVELCDDLANEYWSLHNGKPVEMWMDMGIDSRLELPRRSGSDRWKVGVEPSEQGDLKMPKLDAAMLSELISSGQWRELDNYNPGLLNAIHYQTRQFMPFELSSIFMKAWRNMPESFRETGEAILHAYEQQLLTIDTFGDVIHLPTAAIEMLWHLKDLPRPATIHFFDYGYDTPSAHPAAYMTFQGQVSTPVNFGLLKTAAELMGYSVTLDKDREFIERTTGEDTLIIGRIQGLGLDMFGPDAEDALLVGLFGDAASELCPTADVSEWSIRGLRVRRSAVEDVAARLGRSYSYRDGSFYFCGEL